MASGITYALTRGEAQALKRAAENDRDLLLLEILDQTGVRITEALEFRVGDVLAVDALRFLNEKQSVEALRTKVIYVNDDLVEQIRAYVIREHLQISDYLFKSTRSKTGHYTRQAALALQKRLSAKAGYATTKTTRYKDGSQRTYTTGAWSHQWRHSYAVNAVQQRMPLPAIKAQLGHASLKSTDVYAQMFDPDRKDAAKRMTF